MPTSNIAKRSLVISGRKTSISLEDAFWTALNEIAKAHNQTPSEYVTAIDGRRTNSNLSSAIRLEVLAYYRNGGTPKAEAA